MVKALHTICSSYLMRSVSDLFLADPQLRATTISLWTNGWAGLYVLTAGPSYIVCGVVWTWPPNLPVRALDGNGYLNVNLTYALCFTGYVNPLASLFLKAMPMC